VRSIRRRNFPADGRDERPEGGLRYIDPNRACLLRNEQLERLFPKRFPFGNGVIMKRTPDTRKTTTGKPQGLPVWMWLIA